MKRFAVNAAGTFALLILLVLGLQGSLLLAGLAVGASAGVTLLIYFGADRLGIGLILLATFLAPINGLRISDTGNVTYADFAYAIGFGLLVPHLLQSSSRLPRLYTAGILILVVNALVVSMISAAPIPSLLGFVRVAWAIIVIPIVLHRLKPGRNLLYALAWAYVLGQIVSTAKGVTETGLFGGGRAIGWTTHPNFFGLGGQLAFALCVFLFYRTRQDLRWIVVVAAGICGLSVIQSGSRASLLCVVVTVIFWPLIERTAISSYVLISVGAIAAVGANFLIQNAPEGSAFERLGGGGSAAGSSLAREFLLEEGWAKFLSSPIKGSGWTTDILEYHNAYLEVAIAGGVLALLGFLLVLAGLIKPLFDEPVPNRLAFVALSYAVFAAVGPTLYDRVLWGAMGLILALHLSPAEEHDEAELRQLRTQKAAEREPAPIPIPRRTR